MESKNLGPKCVTLLCSEHKAVIIKMQTGFFGCKDNWASDANPTLTSTIECPEKCVAPS